MPFSAVDHSIHGRTELSGPGQTRTGPCGCHLRLMRDCQNYRIPCNATGLLNCFKRLRGIQEGRSDKNAEASCRLYKYMQPRLIGRFRTVAWPRRRILSVDGNPH